MLNPNYKSEILVNPQNQVNAQEHFQLRRYGLVEVWQWGAPDSLGVRKRAGRGWSGGGVILAAASSDALSLWRTL